MLLRSEIVCFFFCVWCALPCLFVLSFLLHLLKSSTQQMTSAVFEMSIMLIFEKHSSFFCPLETSWSATVSVLTSLIIKNNTSNGARGAKMIFPSGRGAGFKMN